MNNSSSETNRQSINSELQSTKQENIIGAMFVSIHYKNPRAHSDMGFCRFCLAGVYRNSFDAKLPKSV